MAWSVTMNLLKLIPWKLPSLSTLGLKNFCTHRQTRKESECRKTEMKTGKQWLYCAHRFQRAVSLLHAQALQGPDKVKSERLSIFPATYQQANSDLPQDQSLPDKSIDTRPVPWHGDKGSRSRNVGRQPVGHAGFNHQYQSQGRPPHHWPHVLERQGV